MEIELKEFGQEPQLKCTGRFAVETNNLSPWKTIPPAPACASYVKDYMTGRGYCIDLEKVSQEAIAYARSVQLVGDGKDVWVFDIDDTLLSTLPYYAEHGYGSEAFNGRDFDKWVNKAISPAIESSLKLYEEVLRLGFKVFLLSGRKERRRGATVKNLKNAGFQNWDRLTLSLDDDGKTSTLYKSEKRTEIANEGYRILGNSGDQWSDILGSSPSKRSFKLPNPMYYIP
uniref:Acid phosphatase 1-like n=1 Tax=Nelumbo nucifera TaxID=4432 RepID=A0A822XHD6_NELNU|nr:TPA_asm: hypothetical protein HUJ06_019879 [Nelumbo nucifera]